MLCALAMGAMVLMSSLQRPGHPVDPKQSLERTCFQTGQPYHDWMNVGSDVAIVYGIDRGMPARVRSWRDQGYRVHLMTGVSWGEYQDYLYGRFDGVNHEDEAQTERNGQKVSHGGDVYYMCPGENYGKFLCVGVQRALEAGVEAIHLEEPEFWVRSGYEEGFKREWRKFYGEDWQPPHSSPDAQWRASKLKYFLYRRALQQVFDFIQAWNKGHGTRVRCYVPTHSLINYAHWKIVSPESSLARLNGCDGYIAQVWTGTSRTPNNYRGVAKERTFETAFLEYGAMQNLVRSTGRTVWYLNDPVEDDPKHDWGDYRRNWESTLVASLLQPDVSKYEVMPWPERVWGGTYTAENDPSSRIKIPPGYATELQTVCNALNDMDQKRVRWECGTRRVGVVVSDSLMFERGDPAPSDAGMGHFYGLAMPLVKRGIPVEPVQLESAAIPGYLKRYDLLLITYRGMKPLTPEVHRPIADWVRAGGVLVFVDDDRDPFNSIREWWNSDGRHFASPREALFSQLGVKDPGRHNVGKGAVAWDATDPSVLSQSADGDKRLVSIVAKAIAGTKVEWNETNAFILRRGPYVIAAGLDETVASPLKMLEGHFVNLFDPELEVRSSIEVGPLSRYFLIDLDKAPRSGLIAAACRAIPEKSGPSEMRFSVSGVAETISVVLVRTPNKPDSAQLDGSDVDCQYDDVNHLAKIRFPNRAGTRNLVIRVPAR